MLPSVNIRTRAPPPAASLTPGSLARVTDRFGKRSEGIVQRIDGDSIGVMQGDALRAFAIAEVRELEADMGIASAGQRAWRGAKWGFMVSVAAMAISAAGEEFSRSNDRLAGVSDNSPRNPRFAVTIIGAGTAGGAILGSAFWKFRRWQGIPIR